MRANPTERLNPGGARPGRHSAAAMFGAVLLIAGIGSAAPAPLRAAAAPAAAPRSAGAGAALDVAPRHHPGESETRICKSCVPPLVYNSGPVVGTAQTTGELTVTPIYWAPPGSAFPASYRTVVNDYLANIAAASGRADNVYGINTEYYQTKGGQQSPINYLLHAGAEIDDTNPYPGPQCTVDAGYTTCVDDPAIRSELAAQNLTADLGHLYAVFFPPGVETRDGSGGSSAGEYCGYHSDTQTGSGTFLYANEPYPTLDGCGTGQAPNGDAFADAQVSVLSHEINETITDPLGNGWLDQGPKGKTMENGDQCTQNYGDPLGSTDPANPATTMYNQAIGTGRYYTQAEFSNRDFASGPMRGCALSAQAGPIVDQNTVTVRPTTTQLPPDGTTGVPVAVDVVGTDGMPVAGDHIGFSTAAQDSGGACGTLDHLSATTDGEGRAKVLYTASRANLSCTVDATEADTGRTSEAQLNQGTPSEPVPDVSLDQPPDITAGAPPAEFTGSASNPTGSDIPDARIDVVLSGDDNPTHGVRAAQVHLSVEDSTTGGRFVNVPLEGTTQHGGEITGFLGPEAGSSFAAHSSDPMTFRISIDPSAPSSDSNAVPLSLSLVFDEVDPADGSTDTVADVTGSIPVHVPPHGYWLVAADGGIFPFGGAGGYGSTGGIHLNRPIVGMASTPSGRGYWLVASDGGIFPFGDAGGYGSTGGIHLNQPIVGMAATPSGHGYWLVAADGGIFPFGDAEGFGSTGNIHLNRPIVGMATTPEGRGYWLVASDGGIFPFGDAAGFGSTGNIHLNQPIVGMAAAPQGQGYWLVATDGGIFPFGPQAVGYGSTGAIHLNRPIVGMSATGDGLGYWLVASDGGIFPFGDAPGYGSTGDIQLNRPMVGMAGF